MIRMYPNIGAQLLTVLQYAKARELTFDLNTRGNLSQFMRDYARNGTDVQVRETLYRHLENNGVDDTVDIPDLIAMLVDQLTNEPADSDLIDGIVNVLELPYARNVLSGRNLEALKKAILLPSEMADAGARLRERELSCGECGRLLTGGMAATILIGDRNTVTVTCTNCAPPTLVACARCREGVAQLDKRTAVALNKGFTCGCDQEKKMAPGQLADEGVAGPAPEPPWRGRRQATLTNTTLNTGGAFAQVNMAQPANPWTPAADETARVEAPTLTAAAARQWAELTEAGQRIRETAEQTEEQRRGITEMLERLRRGNDRPNPIAPPAFNGGPDETG